MTEATKSYLTMNVIYVIRGQFHQHFTRAAFTPAEPISAKKTVNSGFFLRFRDLHT